MSVVRVRIAPSPSGYLHIGTAKMALMNWLYARSTKGTFVLRLEDTDAERTDEAFVEGMCEGLRWLDIDWDEGPSFGGEPEKGPYGPYRQSLRIERHRAAAERLLSDRKAYKCYCTKEELDAERERARAEKRPARLCSRCRNLTDSEAGELQDRPFTIRFRVPDGETVVEDIVQGPVRTQNAEFDDFVILKPNGDPIFHLAVVVDDAEMQITHVIRGDDHLTNAAKHKMLFEALGYTPPKFAHLPLVLDDRGRKYSKREHGANVLDWRADGYLPEALTNYIVLLGWAAGDDREVYTRPELIEAFSLDRLGKSAAKFDLKKLQWLNRQHIKMLTQEQLRDRLVPVLEQAGYDTSARSGAWLARMAAMCQEKLTTLNDIVPLTDFFFQNPEIYEEKAVMKHFETDRAQIRLDQIREVVEQAKPFIAETLHARFEQLAERSGDTLGKYVHPFRLALTGKSVGPGVFELAELLGRDECAVRLNAALDFVKALPDSQPASKS